MQALVSSTQRRFGNWWQQNKVDCYCRKIGQK